MTLGDIQKIMESWTPEEIAWERDNTGLQIGSINQSVKNILVSLDISQNVLEEARRKKIDIVISHHPPLLHPLKRINFDERIGRLAKFAIENKISLYSAHTNLDFTADGVSFALAKNLGLKNIDFLLKDKAIQKKIVVFVPIAHVNIVIKAMANKGAGIIGNYKLCSFGSEGTGTFMPGRHANPFVGKIGKMVQVKEIRLEMIAPSWKVDKIIAAMKEVHPYEEVAYDIYNITNPSNDYGAGVIGELPKKMDTKKFFELISRRLKLPVIKHNGGKKSGIKRVVVCGGSGSELLTVAIQKGADAFITSDISYHRFEETDGKLVIIDAGHFETEVPVIDSIVNYLRKEIKNKEFKARVFKSNVMRSHVKYFIP